MRSRASLLRSRLLLLALPFVASTAAAQGDPYPPNCSAATAASGQVSVFTVPNGNGNPLTQAYEFGFTTTDATITVELLDSTGIPVPGVPAEDVWLETSFGGLALCPNGSIADGPSSGAGLMTFSGVIEGGGHSDPGSGELCWVYVNGVPLVSQGMDILFNSPDINGDLVVDDTDVAIFNGDFGGSAYRSDFNFDGDVNLGDLGIFAEHQGAACLSAPGTVIIDADPDAIAAGWDLVGPGGFTAAGNGDQTITDAPPGDYTLTWQPVACWTEPSPNPVLQTLPPGGTITFAGTYLENGTVTIDPEPDSIAAGWELSGPDGFFTTGNGDSELTCLTPGDYTINWQEVEGWILNCPDPETQTLAPASNVVFACTYDEAGTIIVELDPDDIGASWQLTGPGAVTINGDQDTVLEPMPVGAYEMLWNEVPGWVSPFPNPDVQTLAAQDTVYFTGLYDPGPEIVSVTDVGNDQGRQVRVLWNRCLYDAPDDGITITDYGIYRRQDAHLVPAAEDDESAAGLRLLAGWDHVTTVPARGDAQYQTVVPTLCDSTDVDGICWSVFMVSAMTPDPLVFFDSRPDSGYSVDNLSPSAPQGVAVAYEVEGNVLSWEENPETDIREYRIYRSLREGPTGDDCGARPDEPLAVVTTLEWTDDLSGVPGAPWEVCYFLTAVDFAGNEGPPTLWYDLVTAVPTDGGLPQRVALYAAVPNPFNPLTRIRFDLPRTMGVQLTIYDLSGRLVETLVDEPGLAAGQHEAVWQGDDRYGRRAAAGVYFYRLQTEGFDRTRRMVLLK